MIPTRFFTIIVVCLFVMACFYGFASDNMYLVYGIVFFPVAVYLIQRPELWLAVLVAIYSSNLKFPQAPANLNAYHLMSMAMLAFLVFYRIVNPNAPRRRSPARKYVFLFAAVVVAIGFYRGFGLKMFGSRLWGGAPYIVLPVACLLLLSVDLLALKPRLWRNALVAMCLLAFLPAMAQLLYVMSGGAIVKQYLFIQPLGFLTSTLEAVSGDSGVPRFSTNAGVTLLYLPLLLYAEPFILPRGYLTVALAGGAILLAGLSGSRYSVIVVVTFLVFYSVLSSGRLRLLKPSLICTGLVVTLSVAALFGRHLPLPIQRTLSFIPWADISWDAKADAMATTTWRIQVWDRAIHEDLPKYWLIGRGFAYDPREYDAIRTLGSEVRDWAFVTGSYHNGPLSLILNLGLLGFLCGLGFFISTARSHYRLSKSEWSDSLLQRLHLVMLAMFMNQAFLFLTLGGDVQNFFPIFLYQATVLEGLARSKMSLDAGHMTPEEPSRSAFRGKSNAQA